jgi:hypothetical protein
MNSHDDIIHIRATVQVARFLVVNLRLAAARVQRFDAPLASILNGAAADIGRQIEESFKP